MRKMRNGKPITCRRCLSKLGHQNGVETSSRIGAESLDQCSILNTLRCYLARYRNGVDYTLITIYTKHTFENRAPVYNLHMCLSTLPILGGVSSITPPCRPSSYRILTVPSSCLIISISASPEFSWSCRRGSIRAGRRTALPCPGESAVCWRELWRGGTFQTGFQRMGLLSCSC